MIFKTNDGTPTNPTSAWDTYLASEIYSSWQSGSGAWEIVYWFSKHHYGEGLTDSMIIKGGRVGIGNTAPSQKLDVTGSIKTSETVILGSEPTSSNHAATKNYVDSKPTTFLGLTDTPSSFTANKLLAVNSGGNAVEFIDTPSTVSANPSAGGAELATISIDGVNYNLPHKTNAITGGDILLFHADVINAGASTGGTLSNINIYTTFKYLTGETPTQSSTAKNSIFKGHNFITEAPQTNSNGTYVSSLTIPKDTPTELELLIQGWKCGGSTGVSGLTVTRNGVYL